jgi:hypothetical protein
MPIFRFRKPAREAPLGPLANQKSAAAWFRELPAVDTIGRQQVVMRAIQAACRPGSDIDFEQVAAIEFLDAELATDRGRLIAQYVEHAEGSTALANRIWQAAHEICQGFVVAYRSLLERALGAASDPRWKAATPRLFARLIHFHGTDAKLRVLRNEAWVPAKWFELHRLYRRALDLRVERVPTGAVANASGVTGPTVEREYVAALLTHLLNTGALMPREIDWVAAQIRVWAEGLELDDAPRAPGGFVVDLGGRQGLVRRSGTESDARLRYLDTGPLVEQLDRALTALRRLVDGDPEDAGPASRQRIGILERLRPVLAPETPRVLPREPRIGVGVPALLRVGLAQIWQELSSGDLHNQAVDITAGLAPEALGESRGATTVPALVAPGERNWRLADRSATGLRLVASAALGQNLALGMLVAVGEPYDQSWTLGVVRRVARPVPENIEAGVSIIASRAVAVALHAKRQAREDMGFVVDGVDVSTVGERFDGLYLPPPSRPDRPLGVKTLVVPATEYVQGRRIILITPRTVYTVALGEALEHHTDWIWATMDIVDRTVRD